jgi:hypothetical protein
MVREKNGRTIEKDQEDKDVYFCDLGILPVEVKVGSDGVCSQTTIRNVPVFADKTYLLNVTYDPEAFASTEPRTLLPLLARNWTRPFASDFRCSNSQLLREENTRLTQR